MCYSFRYFWETVAQTRPKGTLQQAQGIDHMHAEQNKPKFGPKHPGVGIWHTLVRSVQSARGACAGLLARKKTKIGCRRGFYLTQNIVVYL